MNVIKGQHSSVFDMCICFPKFPLATEYLATTVWNKLNDNTLALSKQCMCAQREKCQQKSIVYHLTSKFTHTHSHTHTHTHSHTHTHTHSLTRTHTLTHSHTHTLTHTHTHTHSLTHSLTHTLTHTHTTGFLPLPILSLCLSWNIE